MPDDLTPEQIAELQRQQAETQRQLEESQARVREQEIALARQAALTKYPRANADLLAMFRPDNIEQIEEFAKTSHEAAVALETPPPAPPAPGTPPIPTPAPQDAPAQGDIVEARVQELTRKLEARMIEPIERDELESLLERKMWNTHVGKINRLAGVA